MFDIWVVFEFQNKISPFTKNVKDKKKQITLQYKTGIVILPGIRPEGPVALVVHFIENMNILTISSLVLTILGLSATRDSDNMGNMVRSYLGTEMKWYLSIIKIV